MSFMFNPFPYDDPDAVNLIDGGGIDLSDIATGNGAVAARLRSFAGMPVVIGVDGYPTAPLAQIAEMIPADERIDVRGLLRGAPEIEKMLRDYLPEDRVKDPVLLYGKVFDKGYRALFDDKKVADLKTYLTDNRKTVVLYGFGALSSDLAALCSVRIFADITPKRAVLNVKAGGYRNLGADRELPFKAAMRRNYYVDFELAFQLRWKLVRESSLDYYIAADRPDCLTMLPGATLGMIVSRLIEYPFRCRPVYLEGVWGGYSVMNRRNLPREMKNCAWVFDMIPMEVSTVVVMGGRELELPFYTVVQSAGEKLLGARCMREFGGYFPIRFNYDDTFHSSGNMSVQLHPGEEFLVKNHGELGRQDESYYIVETGQDAKTYLGFNGGADPEEFLHEVKRSEKEHTPVDYQKYIHAVSSKPGVQVMIPAGTIHASGRNQLILEIGSLTIGSYTYKLYDYLRKDLDGTPRPIHTYFGEKNLNRAMTEDYVETHLVDGGKRVVRSGGDWCEIVIGECEQLYFSLRNLIFGDRIEDETSGDFHVLALVDGEQVEVRAKDDPTRRYVMNYLDIVVVPASMGAYEIINQKPGTRCVIHKTLLKR